MFPPTFVGSDPPSLGGGVAYLLEGPAILGTMTAMSKIVLLGSSRYSGVPETLLGLCLFDSKGGWRTLSCSTSPVGMHLLLLLVGPVSS